MRLLKCLIVVASILAGGCATTPTPLTLVTPDPVLFCRDSQMFGGTICLQTLTVKSGCLPSQPAAVTVVGEETVKIISGFMCPLKSVPEVGDPGKLPEFKILE